MHVFLYVVCCLGCCHPLHDLDDDLCVDRPCDRWVILLFPFIFVYEALMAAIMHGIMEQNRAGLYAIVRVWKSEILLD